MLFSGKENVFMCLVAFQKMFQKIFSNVWLCSWKYHRKHIFYLLLTFSHIFSVTKRIYNIIHSSKHKQNPEKKSSNPDKRRRDRNRRFARSARCRWCQRTAWCRWCCDLFSLSLSLSLSLSSIFQGWKSFEVKMETEMIFCCFGSQIRSTRNAFQFDQIWSNNQTPLFSEK